VYLELALDHACQSHGLVHIVAFVCEVRPHLRLLALDHACESLP
jgi:hypothetical protein